MIVKVPNTVLRMGDPLPPLGIEVTSWTWPLSKALQDWSAWALKFPLGTIIHDVIDGHPIVAQLQVHDTYGAHPEWGIKPHKGTSIYVPSRIDELGQRVALSNPPPGWVDAAISGEGYGPRKLPRPFLM